MPAHVTIWCGRQWGRVEFHSSHSGTQALSIWEHHIFKLQSLRLSCKGRRECAGACGKIYGKPGSNAHYFHPNSVVQSLVAWPNWTARDSREFNLPAYPQEKWHSFVEDTTLSLSYMSYSSHLWAFAFTIPLVLECFPLVPAKYSPSRRGEYSVSSMKPSLIVLSPEWINYGIVPNEQFTTGLPWSQFVLCGQVWIAALRHWEVKGHDLNTYVKKCSLEVNFARHGTYWNLIGCNKKSTASLLWYSWQRCITWIQSWGNRQIEIQDIVPSNQPIILKCVEVTKIRERSKNYFGVKEASHDGDMRTKCNV